MKTILRIATGHQFEYIEFELDENEEEVLALIRKYHNIALKDVKPVKNWKRPKEEHQDDISKHAAL